MAPARENLLLLVLLWRLAPLAAYKPPCPVIDFAAVPGSLGEDAVLPCDQNSAGPTVTVHWYRYSERWVADLLVDSEDRSRAVPDDLRGRARLSRIDSSLVISEPKLRDSRHYMCQVWANGQCVTHRIIQFTVCPEAVSVHVSGWAGERASLSCIHSPGRDVRWYKYPEQGWPGILYNTAKPSELVNETLRAQATLKQDRSLVFPTLRAADSGDYRCEVWNRRKCISSKRFHLTVTGKDGKRVRDVAERHRKDPDPTEALL
ncbi:uncharacterized protein LOC136771573 isoform X2 [Amia ocellicauda]|uniref:uncharacterized protein LOC136771573 isoform X2 n=1 Tax=Amia ocellicauda TaxID=2972642 RepID=UPI00346485DA